jgi:hypothetical protein
MVDYTAPNGAVDVNNVPADLKRLWDTVVTRLAEKADKSALIQEHARWRYGHVNAEHYRRAGNDVTFGPALPTRPVVVAGLTVQSRDATPLHIMVYAASATGFSWRAFGFDGSERAEGAPVTFDYVAVAP